ncbi:TetR/AcrR family transcriptional regulator [Angustibacter aerolatus]
MTTSATRRTPTADVEPALVDAAATVLVRQGPAALTVRAVAAEAGVAPMGVYSRFGGKDGLVEALLRRGFELLRAAVAGRDEVDPTRRLVASGERYREFALRYPQYYAVMFEGAAGAVNPCQATVDTMSDAFGALVALVRESMDAGVLADGDETDVAQQIWAAVHGAVSLELRGIGGSPDPGATYDRLLAMLVRGLAPEH